MKKYCFIAVAVIAVCVAFFLLKKPNEASGELPVAHVASSVTETKGLRKSESPSVARTELISRIPLPEPEPPELTASLVPTHLHPLFGWKNIGGYVPRRRMVESLGDNLFADEVRALILFARSKPSEVGLSKDDFNGVGDVVLLKLEGQKQLPADYSDHLVVMFYDESRNPQWRDYCIQHLGTVYPRTSVEKHPVIRQLYEDAIKPGSTFAGTALLSMKRSPEGSELSNVLVAGKAMTVADSTQHNDAERLSALHVAAEFNHPKAIDLAREIAVSTRSATFRMASLAVIGQRGNESDLALLEKHSKSSDIRLRTAATEALKNLSRE
jgi:hypothetical protein